MSATAVRLRIWTMTFSIACLGSVAPLSRADDMPIEQACRALVKYEYGQDMAPLLALDRWVIESMATDEQRRTCAARLAHLLTLPESTLAARQYICLQLRQVGTAAEVPVLKRLLYEPATADLARQALQSISGPEVAQVLRGALAELQGPALIGVINSVGARRDTGAVAQLQQFVASDDRPLASAALLALSHIGGEQVTSFLRQRIAAAGQPTPQELAAAVLRCAARLEVGTEQSAARDLYQLLSQDGQVSTVRRAALEGLLRLDAHPPAAILAWFTDPDPQRQLVAAGHLGEITHEQLDQLLGQLAALPVSSQGAVIELAAARKGQAMLPFVLSLLDSDSLPLQLAAIRCLAVVGDAGNIPKLLDLLAAPDARSQAARDTLAALPRQAVIAALLAALEARPQERAALIDVLVTLKSYEAIDPLIKLAAQPREADYAPALAGLRAIADPDKQDLPRLVQLLLRSEPGRHRDEVEKTILLVTGKLPAGADRAALVLQSLAQVDSAEAPKYLPLLGRLGGAAARQQITAGLKAADAAVRDAAVRALCNWPNAQVADQLWDLASQDGNAQHQRWALRAYIRVTTLDAEQEPAKTLAALQQAMRQARRVEDKQLVLQRCAAVRTLETVQWIAPYLDDPDLQQTACVTIVELAHHRYLRHPNMPVFDPLLERVSTLSHDPAIVERAKRYRLGL